jgi:hypothetical protein
MGEGGRGPDYETRGDEEDANLRERRDGTAMGEPHAWCRQEDLLLERGGGARCVGVWNAWGTRGRQ